MFKIRVMDHTPIKTTGYIEYLQPATSVKHMVIPGRYNSSEDEAYINNLDKLHFKKNL